MADEARERGHRLEAFMASLLPEGRERSRSGLARQTGVSRQQLTQWFDGRGEPRFSALEEAAERLGVRRVDLVAAYDGVTAPEQQETPRPEWAEGLEARVDLALWRLGISAEEQADLLARRAQGEAWPQPAAGDAQDQADEQSANAHGEPGTRPGLSES